VRLHGEMTFKRRIGLREAQVREKDKIQEKKVRKGKKG
jgi:hypothetical protein